MVKEIKINPTKLLHKFKASGVTFTIEPFFDDTSTTDLKERFKNCIYESVIHLTQNK